MLTAGELTLLGRLDLAFRRPQSGLYAGERRSPRSARSPEFADFRPYVSGDDFRQIDWKAYARLERLMLRLYVAEEEACLNLVLDSSGSMALGEPPKWENARRLVAALGFLGLAAMDRVQVGMLGGSFMPALRGRDGVHRVWGFLEGQEPAGAAGPEDLIRTRWLRPGLTVVVSDFLWTDGGATGSEWNKALAALAARRQEPVLWQVLAPDEEHPGLSGDLKLIDAESGRARELTITPGLVQEYLRSLAAHREGLARACSGAGGRFISTNSSADLESAMLAGLRAGVVRRG
ncbi:MAG: DUF58 domain-containing protein [Candidatus Dormibacteraeota bacterium]|nr:DUF58 domain-containing protein [Candidatus Dormibacteraeota bacterium]